MIPMSGTANCSFIMHKSEYVRDTCLDFAMKCGFKAPDTGTYDFFLKIYVLDRRVDINAALVDYFRKLSPSQLAITMLGKRGFKINVNGPDLTPVIDGDFFPKPIAELRREVPHKICMTGVTENEGVLFGEYIPLLNFCLVTLKRNLKITDTMNQLITTELIKRNVENVESTKDKLLDIYLKRAVNKKELKRAYIDVIFTKFIHFILLVCLGCIYEFWDLGIRE